MRREVTNQDIKVKTVFLDLPSGEQDPSDPMFDWHDVGGTLSEYFKEHPEEFEAEKKLGSAKWDLRISGDLEDEEAFIEVEKFMVDSMASEHKQRSRTKSLFGEVVDLERISPASLFTWMATGEG